MTDFSVLMPVYAGDRADFVEAALRSVTTEQTLPPTEVVIVQDGPVSASVDAVIRQAHARVVRLEENRGLSEALNVGLAACRFDIVARQDADDVSAPNRFATQVPLVSSGMALVGSDIVEFGESGPGPVRHYPTSQSEIEAALPLRDPFAHPSVVYSKRAVEAVGGYEEPPGMEDYWLFARMVAAGYPCVNVPTVLVSYRVDAGAYRRRGGWRLFLTECAMQRRLYALGVTGPTQALVNLIVRGSYRFIPAHLRRLLYRAVGLRGLFRRR